MKITVTIHINDDYYQIDDEGHAKTVLHRVADNLGNTFTEPGDKVVKYLQDVNGMNFARYVCEVEYDGIEINGPYPVCDNDANRKGIDIGRNAANYELDPSRNGKLGSWDKTIPDVINIERFKIDKTSPFWAIAQDAAIKEYDRVIAKGWTEPRTPNGSNDT